MIHAGLPHRFPAKATITFTSTDGTRVLVTSAMAETQPPSACR